MEERDRQTLIYFADFDTYSDLGLCRKCTYDAGNFIISREQMVNIVRRRKGLSESVLEVGVINIRTISNCKLMCLSKCV